MSQKYLKRTPSNLSDRVIVQLAKYSEKIGRLASEEVIIELLKSVRMCTFTPIFALEVVPSLNETYNYLI